jgi:hypothetical protein
VPPALVPESDSEPPLPLLSRFKPPVSVAPVAPVLALAPAPGVVFEPPEAEHESARTTSKQHPNLPRSMQ